MSHVTIVPVILCGGSGSRLWPASRETLPKQFLKLTCDLSLLQNTLQRALGVSGAKPENVVCVTLSALKNEVIHQLRELNNAAARHVLCEPSARNTAAAVAYAALYVWETFGPDAVMWVLPADHHIGNENILGESLRHALEVARNNYLVTFGIHPTRPDTGYGYIRTGGKLNGHGSVLAASAFVEKPDLATAQHYLESGYLWNSGMFLFRSESVLDHYRHHAPDILQAVISATAGQAGEMIPDAYALIPEQPFDKAIMEKSSTVAVVPCDPDWSDVGSWESLWEISPKDSNGNAIKGEAACVGAQNCLIHAHERLVACAGLDNVVIAETADAILVADRRNGEAIRQLVKTLKQAGSQKVVTSPVQIRSWGAVKTVTDSGNYKVKEITVKPGEGMTLEVDIESNAFWAIIEGKVLLSDGYSHKLLQDRDAMIVPVRAENNAMNAGDGLLKIIQIEYQTAPSYDFVPVEQEAYQIATA